MMITVLRHLTKNHRWSKTNISFFLNADLYLYTRTRSAHYWTLFLFNMVRTHENDTLMEVSNCGSTWQCWSHHRKSSFTKCNQQLAKKWAIFLFTDGSLTSRVIRRNEEPDTSVRNVIKETGYACETVCYTFHMGRMWPSPCINITRVAASRSQKMP